MIATGTTPARPTTVEFDERTVIDSDQILNLRPGAALDGGRRAPA